MKILSKNEIESFVLKGKQLPEKEGMAILDEFQKEHYVLYSAIFGPFSSAIGKINIDMANLFLDLCFDVIWIYKESFGKPTKITNEESWFSNSVALLNAELKSLSDDTPLNSKFKERLRTRLVERSIKSGIQLELFEYLDREVKKYATFSQPRNKAINVTNNFLFVFVRLMDDLYDKKTK